MNNEFAISTIKACMKDGSGNPPDCSSGDYSAQPDAAVTQRKLGHAQKKSLLKMSKGIGLFYVLGEIIRFPRHLCLLSRQHLYNPDTKTYCKENG
jgi:methylase of polypeptide subunit release factors